MRVAIVGEGVVGLSTALVAREQIPGAEITVFSDRPFTQICSYGPAGLFRIDNEQNREFGRETFRRFETIFRRFPGGQTGLKLVSGHIQSDDRKKLEAQERAYGDIVYNFRWLSQREINGLWDEPSNFAIHYTAFATEGQLYVPFLKQLCKEAKIEFEARKINSLDELCDSFDCVFNCAGIDGGRMAGDDDTMTPSRGVVIEVDAPWHKHFNYRNFDTFTIPKTNTVAIGTVKEMGNGSMTITDADRKSILDRYYKLHPQMKEAKVVNEWIGLRPERPAGIRIEKHSKQLPGGRVFSVIHNYGHGPNGFTLSWGSAVAAVRLLHMPSKL